MPKIGNAQACVPATMSAKLAWLAAVHQDSELTYAQKAVAFALFTFHNQTTGRCFPSHEQIGTAVGGMARTAVSGALKALKVGGWVSWVRTRGHSWYQLRLERAGAQIPAEMSGSNDNSPEESGARCHNFQTSDVTKTGHQMSHFPDMEPSTETVYLKPSISSVPMAEATGSGTDTPKASGRIRKKSETKTRRTELPADWQPDPEARAVATRTGVRPGDLDIAIAGFVSHHRGKGNTSPDWPAMWQSWCLGHVERRNQREARAEATKPKKSRFQF